ncbi:MAG: hypothetical protein KHX11_23030 [Bacteroides cellulosilyticus]|uniref:hypothetical protein n=1 Tax=Bacteroides cellulosilyticus TaxID=246787 RepID=UPI0029557400|nr:hypothetical protein [Bacteroides cellulosilyticus]MBS5701899.1 hypothetical protein [Bacteroides cellulosilyticus]MDV7049961.1 hypothetical protein [Bacteroides cellulosilyticus]
MALLEYLNKPVPAPASINEAVSPAVPEGHTVSEIRPAIAPATPEPNYADAIGQKGLYGFFKDFYQKPDLEKEEKITRRERALSLLGDIANLGGQMFASSKGARQFAPINSQVPKYNERLQRIRDAKRANDVDFQNKSLSMIFKDYEGKRAEDLYKRQQEAAKASMEFKYQRDLTLKQIDQAFQVGMLDAKGKQALSQQAARAKDAKELAALNHKYRLSEIKTKDNSNSSKIVDSAIGGDGNVYTRNTRLTPNEAQQIVLGSGMGEEDLAPFLSHERDNMGNITKTKTDWQAAAAYALQNGMIPAEELKSRGFKLGGATDKKEVAPWVSNNQSSNNKAPWLK